MSKYDITYACGHKGSINIVGPYKNRDQIAERESRKLCPECYSAKLAADRAAASAAAAEQAKASGLPALTGSDKQIAWAETIRAKAADQLAALSAKLDSAPASANQTAISIAREIIASTIALTNASAWIDSRDTTYDRHWLSVQTKARMSK